MQKKGNLIFFIEIELEFTQPDLCVSFRFDWLGKSVWDYARDIQVLELHIQARRNLLVHHMVLYNSDYGDSRTNQTEMTGNV